MATTKIDYYMITKHGRSKMAASKSTEAIQEAKDYQAHYNFDVGIKRIDQVRTDTIWINS